MSKVPEPVTAARVAVPGYGARRDGHRRHPRRGRRSSSCRRCSCAARWRRSWTRTASAGPGRGRAGRRGPLQRDVPDPARRGAGCCAARRARRCRRRRTTCCARRGCCAPSQGADVRTPRVLATCEDEGVIGAPFYVMERVEGDVMTTERAGRARGRARRIAEELVDALVEIHAVDWRACGLEGYGKPTGYLDRQLRRFGGLWEHNRTRELPVLERVTAWLAEHRPSPARRRSCTATTGSATRCSRRARRRAWSRSSTGSWRRSATRSPTSATSSRRGRSPTTRGPDARPRRGHAPARLPHPRRADRPLRGALRAARCRTCAGT